MHLREIGLMDPSSQEVLHVVREVQAHHQRLPLHESFRLRP